jgi:TetR/AcrR family transcriptional repressor of nem operon
MSTQDELIRVRVEQFFQAWLRYFEQMLAEAKEQGIVPATLDTAATAQALLAYFEGVMLLAKGRNDPSLLHSLRMGKLSLMQYQLQSRRSEVNVALSNSMGFGGHNTSLAFRRYEP